ncbi:MAG: CooT family nickel-binding protein [Anaerolineales bacterium]|nr:CooT family nickel-binding protein [Anaerolineales bacterium]
MCQAKVLLQREDGSEVIMEDVTFLKVEGDVVWLSRFFEPPVAVRAIFQETDFLKHTVTLLPLDNGEGD